MSTRIEQSIAIDAAPGVIFEALTTPELLRRWLCHEADVEPRVGGRYEMRWSTTDAGASIRYEGSGEIVAFAPGEKLAFRLPAGDGPGSESTVEFQIAARNGSADLTLVQSGFADDEGGRRVRDAYQRGWTACLSVLRSLLEDEPARRLIPAPMHRDLPMPGHEPCGLAWDGRHLWLSDAERGRIFKLDPLTGRTLGSLVFEGEPSGLCFDGECLWQAERESKVLVKINPQDGKVFKRLAMHHLKGELTGVAWDGQHLWVGDGGESEGQVLKVHPRSGIVFEHLAAPPCVSGLAWDGSHLWIGDFEARTLNRVSPRNPEPVARVAVKGHPTGLTFDGERLWYADSEWKLLSRILDKIA